MFKKILLTLGALALIAGISLGGYFVVTHTSLVVAHASTCTDCCNPDFKTDVTVIQSHNPTDGSQAYVVVKNSSNACSYPIGFASYKMFTPAVKENGVWVSGIMDQTLFDHKEITLAPGESQTIRINTPSCNYQTDVYLGTPLTPPDYSGSNYTNYFIKGWQIVSPNGFCSNGPTTGTLTIVKTVDNSKGGTKQVSDFSLFIGSTQVTSGQAKTLNPGTYSVHEDNLPGYHADTWGGDCSTDGSVVVNAGDHKTCTITNHYVPVYSSLNATCTASASSLRVGDNVTYTAHVTGGNGNYTYSWDGTENLSGTDSSITKSYGSTGDKVANLTVHAGSKTDTAQCNVTVVEIPTNLYASCSANSASIFPGKTATYTANVSGGNGSYTYSWSGTDDLSGNDSSISKTYYTQGYKYATVTVTSQGQTITADCNTKVVHGHIVFNDLVGSCTVSPSTATVNQTVTWSATAEGGNGNYTYSWTGWDNLGGYGSSVSKQYSTPGQKTGTVLISDGSSTITKTCYMTVVVPTQSLTASCSANPASAYIGDRVNWSASATGGNGSYNYTWSGTDNVSNQYQSFGQIYSTPGQKSATVTVWSDGQSATQTCNVYIQARPIVVPPPTQVGGVYLSQVPYTGIGSDAKVGFFIFGLLAWSALVSYYMIARKARKQGLSVGQFIRTTTLTPATTTGMDPRLASLNTAYTQSIPENLPTDDSYNALFGPKVEAPVSTGDFMTDLESQARSSRMLISQDAMRMISAMSGQDMTHAQDMIGKLASMYRNDLVDATDWVTLNAEKVSKIISHVRS